MSCLIITQEIKDLANKIQGETPESIKGLVSIWQERNNKSIDEYPSVDEVEALIRDLRDTPKSGNIEDYRGYFEGGGLSIYDHFPNLPSKLVDAVADYFLGGIELSQKDYEDFLNYVEEKVDNTPTITLEDRKRVNLDFTPQMRRDRVALIARLFSNELDLATKEMSDNLNKRIAEAAPEDRDTLELELSSLDRRKVLNKHKPYGIFSRIKEGVFENYVNDTEEGRTNVEAGVIRATLSRQGNLGKYSDEKIMDAARKKAEYKYVQYRKILDNFNALAEETSGILSLTEGILINIDSSEVSDAVHQDTPSDEESVTESLSNEESKEEEVKDGWMTNYREVAAHESLSQAVRKAISKIPRLDYRGKFEKDDLGFPRYLDSSYVHATLINSLSNMITSEDMFPILNDLSRNKIWVKQIIKTLENDEILKSQFYQDFRKDFVEYWIQKQTLNGDGTVSMKTISINKPEGTTFLLDSWRDNYQSHTILDKDSVYSSTGEIEKGKASVGLDIVKELNNKLVNKSTEDRIRTFSEKENWNSLVKALKMIGIDPNQDTLMRALTNIKTAPNITFTDPVMLLLPQLDIIFRGISKGDMTSNEGEQKDLINTFGSVYNSIANILADVTDDAVESSVRENGKTYYSNVNPSYLGKLIKQLKNVFSDSERFEKFMTEEFKNYEWFFKDGRWRNDWLRQLYTSSKMREGLKHKVVLNSNKVNYSDWDSLDYTVALLTEYWGDPESSKTNTKFAWYHVPILSDAPSAEFIRFRRYTTGDEYDANGNKMTYKEIILDKLVDLVNQEYDRIMLVRERSEAYQDGDPRVELIANYDIARKEDGSIKSIGGAEFKFIPALNTLKGREGRLFIEELARIKREGTGDELRTFIKDSLDYVMENEFETAYEIWEKNGLFEEVGGRYKYLPFASQSAQNAKIASSLARAKEVLGNAWTNDMEYVLFRAKANKAINDRVASRVYATVTELLNQIAAAGTINYSSVNSIVKNLTVTNSAKEALREYFWNSTLATSQIIQITTTDLAFYKDLEDFQKRFKEIHAPSLRLDTLATFRGEQIGRKLERTIYIADEEIVSPALEDIEAVLKEQGVPKLDRDYILSQFKKVNVADAQAYRSLSSYRAILGMSGQWTDAMEAAYRNFLDGKFDIADFNIIWQTKKPYLYTQVNSDSGIEGHTGIKTPVQHKNSEFLLLAIHKLVAGNLGKSGKLKAINAFMEKYGIDVVQFESTTKVGKQGVIDLSKATTEQEVMDTLLTATGIGSNNENPNVVHTVSYEDYGIQTETPEHVIDAKQLIGTQIRKLITADISDDTILSSEEFFATINRLSPETELPVIGVTVKEAKEKGGLTKKQWFTLYNAVNTENILQKFREVDKIFSDPKKVEAALQAELKSSPRYGRDLIEACTLDENGHFRLPLYDPIQSQRVQSLLNSIIKGRVTKQKIKGGALIQVSDYGLTDELKIVFEDDGKKRIKYLECYMPAYSREFYEPLIDPNTHVLDIDKRGSDGKPILSDDLRKLIGYRVPTEDKYSMVPLYIKGFLPQQNGSAIMLPAEITSLSGSDFDIDKLYVMIPEFRVQKYDMRKAREDYAKEDKTFKAIFSIFSNSQLAESVLESDTPSFRSWFEERKSQYLLRNPRITKIRYDYSKAPQENSLPARNNLIIDLMYSVLTNADTASKMLNPGGFDEQKRVSRINTILLSSSVTQIEESLKELGKDIKSPIKTLISMDLDGLTKMANKLKIRYNPLSPTTQVYLHQQNMTGAKLIGIYANHNANHALMQHTNLRLTRDASFMLNGKRLTSLHDIKNVEQKFISRNNAGYLAASVDNVKDPVLASLNQNTFTADASMLLSRLGHTPLEIGLLMQQPIIRDITELYSRESRKGRSKDAVIDKVIKDYKERASMTISPTYDMYKDYEFLVEELANNIVMGHSNSNGIDYLKGQVAVGFLFKKIMTAADALGKLTQATRSDTQGGAAGPTIADTIIKLNKVSDLIDAIESDNKFPLLGADVLKQGINTTNETEFRKKLLSSKLPFLQAFYTAGLESTSRLLGRYFPHYNESFLEVLDKLRSMTKSGNLDANTINSIYNDLLTYIMSKTTFFGPEINPRSGKPMNSRAKRDAFINKFPTQFKKIVADNPDIASLEFIKRLKVVKPENCPVDVIVFRNVGRLTPQLRDSFMRDWESLMYMDNPEANKLAMSLFKYSFFRNGFAFGPVTFTHLAPTSVRVAIPEYVSTLMSTINTRDDLTQFVEQYIYNHLNNRKLVPEVPSDSTIKFTDEQKKIKDEVTFEFDKNSTLSDGAVIKTMVNTPDGMEYSFFDFIGRKEGNNWYYYRLFSRGVATAIYRRIEPLGYANNFLEYEYGKDVGEVKSVIAQDKLNFSSDPKTDATETTEDIDTSSNTVTRSTSIEAEAADAAMKAVYGQGIETTTKQDNAFNLTPNVDFKDANGEEVCGTTTIG